MCPVFFLLVCSHNGRHPVAVAFYRIDRNSENCWVCRCHGVDDICILCCSVEVSRNETKALVDWIDSWLWLIHSTIRYCCYTRWCSSPNNYWYDIDCFSNRNRCCSRSTIQCRSSSRSRHCSWWSCSCARSSFTYSFFYINMIDPFTQHQALCPTKSTASVPIFFFSGAWRLIDDT